MAGLELADTFWDVQVADLGHIRRHMEEEGLAFLTSGRAPSALHTFRSVTFRICEFHWQFWAGEVKKIRCMLHYLSRESRDMVEKGASQSLGGISHWQQESQLEDSVNNWSPSFFYLQPHLLAPGHSHQWMNLVFILKKQNILLKTQVKNSKQALLGQTNKLDLGKANQGRILKWDELSFYNWDVQLYKSGCEFCHISYF